MVAHPNRVKGNRRRDQSPPPAEVRAARQAAGLTQRQAAKVIYGSERGWQNYELEGAGGRPMHAAAFELFMLKTGQWSLEQLLDEIAAEAWDMDKNVTR